MKGVTFQPEFPLVVGGLAFPLRFVRWRDTAMKGETRELWVQLCEQAAVEQDPNRLLELVTRINDLLEQKERRLKAHESSASLKLNDTQ